MDTLAFRLANRLVGNAPDSAALEMTTLGARLRFDCDCIVAIAGARYGREARRRSIGAALAELSRSGGKHSALWRCARAGHAHLS
jgi:allophanate hydrolase subunit 2